MTKKEFMYQIVRMFFVLVTLINIAMFIFGKMLQPNTTFGYRALILPVIYAVAGVLPMIVMYSDRELTVKEVIVRKIIQFLLIEMSIIFIIFGKDFMFSEHRQLLFAIALCIFIVFVFANIISWEMDRVVARRMTEKLISLQTSSLQNKN